MTWDLYLSYYLGSISFIKLIICSGYIFNAFLWSVFISRSRDMFNFRDFNMLPMLWLSVTIVFIIMGVIRLFNFEIWITNYLREIAIVQGWYGQRHTVQVLFITTVAVTGLVILILLERSIPLIFRFIRIILSCLVLSAGLFMIDVVSFHPFDKFFNGLIVGKSFRTIMDIFIIIVMALSLFINIARIPVEIRGTKAMSADRYI